PTRRSTDLDRHKKVLKLSKGYFGSKHTLYKVAKQQVMKSGNYAYRDRRQKKRDFRKLWIARINAAARQNDISYSRLMNGLKLAGIEVKRKMLSEIAISDAKAFAKLDTKTKDSLAKSYIYIEYRAIYYDLDSVFIKKIKFNIKVTSLRLIYAMIK